MEIPRKPGFPHTMFEEKPLFQMRLTMSKKKSIFSHSDLDPCDPKSNPTQGFHVSYQHTKFEDKA